MNKKWGALFKRINKGAKNLLKSKKSEISKFSERPEFYRQVPTNEKEINRMHTFSSNEFLVNFILGLIEQHNYPNDGHYLFDTVSYWYCICLFMLSDQEKAKNVTLALVNHLLRSEHKDLQQFRRILEFIDKTEYHPLREEIENHLLSC